MHSEGCCFKTGVLNGKTTKICLGKLPFNKPRGLSNVSERINAFPTHPLEGIPFICPPNSNFHM